MTNYITVTAPVPAPSPAFSATPVSGNSPLTVAFTDLSTGNPDAWTWSFGDGSISSEKNPSHTYTAAGTYTVSLAVANSGGSATKIMTDYITVTAPVPAPSPAFSATPVSGNSPLTVAFTDLSTGNPDSWTWSFGDGGIIN